MGSRVPVFSRAALAAVLFAAIDAGAWEQTVGEGQKGIRWTGSCYYYSTNEKGSDNLSFEDLQAVARESFDTWEEIPCSYFRFVATAPASADRVEFNLEKGNVNLLVWRENAADWPYDERAVGMTTTQYDLMTGDILDVDMEFNGAEFDFGSVQPGSADANLVDLQSAITHEIGHTLGFEDLYDSAFIDSTMYAYDSPGEIKKRTLVQDDIDGLCTLYPGEEDPELCEKPYCGLDLRGTFAACDPDGEEPKDGGSTDEDSAGGGGCQTAAPASSRGRHFWGAVLSLFGELFFAR